MFIKFTIFAHPSYNKTNSEGIIWTAGFLIHGADTLNKGKVIIFTKVISSVLAIMRVK